MPVDALQHRVLPALVDQRSRAEDLRSRQIPVRPDQPGPALGPPPVRGAPRWPRCCWCGGPAPGSAARAPPGTGTLHRRPTRAPVLCARCRPWRRCGGDRPTGNTAGPPAPDTNHPAIDRWSRHTREASRRSEGRQSLRPRPARPGSRPPVDPRSSPVVKSRRPCTAPRSIGRCAARP